MPQNLPWTPWHKVVKLREDVLSGELSLADFAADLHDVAMQKGTRPIYEDPERFFALTFPTLPLRDLARDVALRLAGQSTKAIRQLELTYGGGKTHTLVTLYHLAHDPQSLPDQPTVDQFRSHIGADLAAARVAALCFDKLDVEKGMEVRGPAGELRWLKHPWSVLAFQLDGAAGLRAIHPDDADDERETPPAEPLLAGLLERPQADGLATLVLIDEVLMYAREKTAMEESWRARLIDFFQYLCQAVTRVDRCALVASLLASDPTKSDTFGKQLTQQIFDVFNRQREEGIQPVQREDVAEVLRRRFFEPGSIAKPDSFRPHVTAAVKNIATINEDVRKNTAATEKRFREGYPFHPDLTDIFYTKWTQLDGFQRTRGILRVFAIALREAEQWDTGPLVGPNVFLAPPDASGLAEAARELAGTATREVTDGIGNSWSAVLEGELAKARSVEDEQPALKHREIEQAVCGAFLSSQPIGQKAHTPELMAMVGATAPDRIELEKGLRRWTDISWFLDEAEFGSAETGGGSDALPKAWRLGNRPNLKQMHHDACANRVTEELIEQTLISEVRKAKSLVQGASAAGARVHMLPERPHDIGDDGEFHFAVLGPRAVSDSGKPSAEAKRFVDDTTGPDRPRVYRNAVVLVAPSRDGLDAVRTCIRDHLGWEEVRSQLAHQKDDPTREAMLASSLAQARARIPAAIRQAWVIVVTVDAANEIRAFKVTATDDPLFTTVKADRRARIQETAISAAAMLPEGPYDLWREDEPSRRVKDLAGAFAAQPKLPKMLRRKEILDTIDQGVRDGAFVASLPRPDKSVKTWWRTAIDEAAREEAALEISLPDKATLSELDPHVLVPGVLPVLWRDNEPITVADVVECFAQGRTLNLQRDGYEEPVAIPACPRDAVEIAISDAVDQGILWLVNGPASYQGEAVPAGVLTNAAELRSPVSPLPVDQLTSDALPEAWQDGKISVFALSRALEPKTGAPPPWSVMRETIDNALSTRWLEIAPDSHPWPCDAADAGTVWLKEPSAKLSGSGTRQDGTTPGTKGIFTGSSDLEGNQLQDLVEVLPSVLDAAAGVPLRFSIRITLGDGGAVPAETVSSVNDLLTKVKSNLSLKE